MTNTISLQHIKALTNHQYDACRAEAIRRIRRKVGDRPERRDFQRQLDPLWQPLDFVALLVGLSAWLVSSIHILTHAARIAANSFSVTVENAALAGWIVDSNTYGKVHQAGLIVLAESAMIMFMIMHEVRDRRPQKHGENVTAYLLRTGPSIPLLLALMAAGFALYANLQSGVGLLESVLPPAVTIGLGIYFERLISEMIQRRKEVTIRYLDAMRVWEAAQKDIESHPDFLPYFRQAIAQKLMSLKPQRDYPNVPIGVIKQAVAREMYRDQWSYETRQSETQEPITLVPRTAPTLSGATYGVQSDNGQERVSPAALE